MTVFRALFMALLCLTAGAAHAQTAPAEVWFNPREFPGWLDMFRDDSVWKQAAKRVNVLELEPSFLGAASDADILTITNYARANGKKLAFVAQAIARPTNRVCGGTEGYAFATEMAIHGKKLKRLNVILDYLRLDEPMWFGHYDTEPLTCQSSIAELTTLVASTVNDFVALYPGIQVIEIEPAGPIARQAGWRQDMASFLAGLERLTGKPVRTLHLDVDWHDPQALQIVAAFDQFTRETNRGLGIIYNGTGSDPDVTDWIGTAVKAFEDIEGRMAIEPTQAIFMSWNVHPARNLPETDPTTLTWLINRYDRAPAYMQVHPNGEFTTGQVTGAAGHPIAGATVNIVLPGVDFSQALPTAVLRGTAPANAAYVLLGARLNMECGCDGMNDVLLGTMVYRETAGGSIVQPYTYPVTTYATDTLYVTQETVGGTVVSRIIAKPGQTWLANSDLLPVTPGASYTLTVPAGTVGGEGWHGHGLAIWFDAAKNGIVGSQLALPAGQTIQAAAAANADGRFVLPRFPSTGRGAVKPTVVFPGDALHRSVTWTPR